MTTRKEMEKMFRPNEREYRAFTSFRAEDKGDDNSVLIVAGTPIVFNSETVLFEFDGIQYKEKIDPAALDECDMSDFILNRNHGQNDSTVFARSKNGSLEYDIQPHHMDIKALLDPEDQRHVDLYRDIKKGLVDKMSFAFVVADGGDDYDPETHTRTIRSIRKLYDVSCVDFPAYDQTSLTVARSFFSEEHEKEFKALEERVLRQKLILKTYL